MIHQSDLWMAISLILTGILNKENKSLVAILRGLSLFIFLIYLILGL